MSNEEPPGTNPPVVVKRGAVDRDRNPDLQSYSSVVLREGPRSRKTATHYEIVDRNTGQLHHHAVKIETLRKRSAGLSHDDLHTVTIGDEDSDEISRLIAFLSTVRGLQGS